MQTAKSAGNCVSILALKPMDQSPKQRVPMAQQNGDIVGPFADEPMFKVLVAFRKKCIVGPLWYPLYRTSDNSARGATSHIQVRVLPLSYEPS